MRQALAGIILAILVLVGMALGAWGVEKLGYIEMGDRHGRDLRPRMALYRRMARWGVPALAIPAMVLTILLIAR